MHLQRLLGTPIFIKCRRLMRRFVAAARDPRAAQERVLLAKLRRNADSAFGRANGFASIASADEFRRRLPVADYEDFRPWVERMKRGDPRALLGSGEELIMFAVTSGTEGEPKHVPVTRSFLGEYEDGWHLWGLALHDAHVRALDHTILRVVSPADEYYSEGGIPCGAVSGLITRDLPWYIRQKYVPPLEAAAVKHAPSKYYLIARFAVVRNVSLFSSANPSTVLAVVRAADEHRERIVRDVRDGTIDSALEIPPETRKKLARFVRPDRRRARELDLIVRRTGRLLPKEYWPELAVLANWKGGSCGVYLARYPEYFGETPVRDIGLLASEGRMTLPFRDEGASGVLDVTTQFFEFIPEAEWEAKDPPTLLAHELKLGERYGMVVTTSSGFCRYDMQDVVRVTGFFHNTPEVEFLNKSAAFSSVTGEKLSEHQVVTAMAEARSALGRGPIDGVLSPMSGDPPRYSLSAEADAAMPRSDWRAYLVEFERRLRALNVEYESKRASGRLGDPVLHLLVPGAFERLKDRQVERAKGRREQYKHRFISGEMDYHRRLPVAEEVGEA